MGGNTLKMIRQNIKNHGLILLYRETLVSDGVFGVMRM